MNQDPEELASAGVHDKVFEVVARLPGKILQDAPTGQGGGSADGAGGGAVPLS